MKRIDAIINNKEYAFLTNDNGEYFFVLENGSTRQLSCFSGFNSLRKCKRFIREYLELKLDYGYHVTDKKMPRIKYELRRFDDWNK